jgi:hypothetical protein
MELSFHLFQRIEPGVWRCVKSGEVITPHGRHIRVFEGSTFRTGSTYMDLDIASWLETHLHEARNADGR